MSEIKQIPLDLTSLIQRGKVIMFSKSTCPYCIKAKHKLNSLKVPFEYIETNQSGVTTEQIRQLHQFSNHRTYPNIYIGTKGIGGCDNLHDLINNKQLQPILDEQGITYDKKAVDEPKGFCNIF